MHLWRMAAALLVPALAACVYTHSDPNGPPPDQNTQPMTVVVDTGQTMNVQGGQGVGVFVEYRAGGHWHAYWTCDTALSSLPCDFQISISGKSITNAASSQFEANDTLSSSTPDVLVATTHTTTGVDAVDFDAAPGQDVKIDLTVSGLRDGRFFFFVQNGQVNGNFQGILTDPLIFEPSAP